MKRTILLLSLLCAVVLAANAQSQFISFSPMGVEDRYNSQLNGNGGVLILSEISDLVVTVVQAPSTAVERSMEKNRNGYYEYTLDADCKAFTNSEAKIEVAKRGDVNRMSFMVKLRPNYLRAYLVEEVSQPIVLENQTAGNDAKLDATKAVVEISSTLASLKVEYDEALGATLTKTRKTNDASVSVYTLTIPIANIESVRSNLQSILSQHKKLDQKLLGQQNGTDAEWKMLDQLEKQRDQEELKLKNMCTINISAEETNRVSIDISNLGARSKMCYGVLLLNKEVEVTNCNRWMREGGKLYAQTKYGDAKRAYQEALNSNDKPDGVTPIIMANMAQCDTCLLYSNMAVYAIRKIADLKKQATVVQTEVAEYYGAASYCMGVLYKYNPIDEYKNMKTKLDGYIENMPLAMKIYTVGWMVSRAGAKETGPLSGVELWAYYGDREFVKKEYKSDDKFGKLSEKSNDFKKIGVTDANGVIDMELLRNNLPKGFFFRPTTVKDKADVEYLDMQYIMAKAKGEYMKRQFRMKMYIRK